MTSLWIKPAKQGILFKTLVQPRSSENKILGRHGDALKIKLTAPPVDGAANKMLITFLSKILGIPKTRIQIKTGSAGRQKQIMVRCAKSNPEKGEIDRIRTMIAALETAPNPD